MEELFRLSARAAVELLKKGEITPGDLLDAMAARVEAVEPAVNALPTLCLDRARTAAAGIDRSSLLAGLPVVIKDMEDVASVRTTYGSPIYADHVPETSDILVQILEANGGLVAAKSNTPEFAAGANTFNEVFGATLNPWNTALSSAGSSGGSAAALATGTAWLATGSDLGGSLRNPASFCSVVGLRPSPGRVARGPTDLSFENLSAAGPMARNVGDVGLMLDAMVGHHPGDPISLPAPAESFRRAAEAAEPPLRVAYSKDLGVTPVDPEVAEITRTAAGRYAETGSTVDEAAPDLDGAHETFQTLRALLFAANHRQTLADHRDKLKPEVIWNIEKGLKLDGETIARAMTERGRLYRNMAAFMADYDVLALPATIVPPYPVEQRYVEQVGEHRFETYVDWLAIAYAITLTGCPALSLPCGFTADGLPVGLQLVGRPQGEAALLSHAAALEAVLGISERTPIDPISAS